MKKTILRLAIMLWILFAAYPAYCSTYFVDPNGNDSNVGDINHPFKTIPHAVGVVAAGDTIYLRGGRHYYSAKISISKVGTSSARYNLIAYPGDANRPILDFSAMAYDSSNRGISLSGQYWHIKGLDIYKAGDNGMNISGSNNIIEFCSFYENCDSGLQLGGGASNNQIINCDSYYNYDYLSSTPGGNADGFSPKLDVGTGNYFYGCRSWQNSDDAYDGYLTTANEVTTTYEKCWAFKAGYLKNGSVSQGNGNGFKMGSSTNNHNVILKNCLSFQNKAKGFDQNHNKGSMTLYNCTAYGNGGANFSIYETLATGKTATVKNGVAYTGGTNNLGTFVVQATNSWMSPFVVTSADFVSTDPSAAYGARKADGSLPDINFMHLAAGSDLINGGTNVGLPYHGSAPDLGYFEYGGCTSPATSDLNGDCEVDFFDYALLTDVWAGDLMDIAQFAIEWLTCNRDPASECWQQ
ncbi:MAG: right-handed parallel beta-helix repeat-containing protein [Sedimentisphaerales bacterium]|jgi:hypothetical protein